MKNSSKHADAEPHVVPLKRGHTIETADKLRIAIDRGLAGDKVDAADPAGAPLGTDDEAAGTPPTAAQVRAAAAHEVHARPTQTPQRRSGLGHAWWLVGYIAALTASVVAGCAWFGLI